MDKRWLVKTAKIVLWKDLMVILLAGMFISPFILSKIAAQESSVETVKTEKLMSSSKISGRAESAQLMDSKSQS
jgi:hypothetical protein